MTRPPFAPTRAEIIQRLRELDTPIFRAAADLLEKDGRYIRDRAMREDRG